MHLLSTEFKANGRHFALGREIFAYLMVNCYLAEVTGIREGVEAFLVPVHTLELRNTKTSLRSAIWTITELARFRKDLWRGELCTFSATARAAAILFLRSGYNFILRKAKLKMPPGPLFPHLANHTITFLCRHQGERLLPGPRG